MNRFEFYSNVDTYKSLSHSNGYKPAGTHEYVAKLDNFWGPGKHRYFYSRQEWDNYNKNAGYAKNSGKDRANTQNKSTNKTYQQNKGYAQNAGADRAKKEEWNAASKKISLFNNHDEKLEAEDKFLNDRKDRYSTDSLEKFDSIFEHHFEKGKGFYTIDDPRDLEYGKAKMDDSYRFKLGDSEGWEAPGLKDPNEHQWDDEDEEKLVKYNQPLIEHCLDFYETYALKNDETWPSGAKKYSAWDVEREIQDYLNRVIPKAFPEYRDMDQTRYITGGTAYIPNRAGYALKNVLWRYIENRIDSEKKAWNRTHKK